MKLAKRLAKLEHEAARLVMHIDDVHDYHSVRLVQAHAAAATARDALRDARIVVEATQPPEEKEEKE
jgi:hypothetical protein